jgi:hypothetical protein
MRFNLHNTIIALTRIHLFCKNKYILVIYVQNVLVSVMDEVNCAMKYINHFVDSSYEVPKEGNLDQQDIDIINQAAMTINNWNTLCEEGVIIAMSNNPDIQYIKQANADISINVHVLQNASVKLKQKLNSFKFSSSSPNVASSP